MALGYFFLEKFIDRINPLLEGSMFKALLSHRKNALVIEFYVSKENSKFLILDLTPGKETFKLANSFSYPKKNTAPLFPALIGVKVQKIEIVKHERIFFIQTEMKDLVLVFKIFGNRSNIILLKPETDNELFKNRQKEDLNFNPDDLKIPPSNLTEKIQSQDDLKKRLPYIDKVTSKYLFENGFYDLDLELQKKSLEILETKVTKDNSIFISKEDPPELSFFPFPGWEELGTDILTSLYEYEKRSRDYFQLKLPIENAKKDLKRKIKKVEESLKRLGNEYENKLEIDRFSRKADLLMANLHLYQNGNFQAEVEDFYTGKKEILKIKEGQSPQAQAEKWYKKSKSRSKELEMDLQRIESHKDQKDLLDKLFLELLEVKNPKSLEQILSRIPGAGKEDKGGKVNIPFRQILFEGYEIRVGKSGEKNDQLLSKWSRKDDLWFHVRDAPGSHVIVINPSKKPLPKGIVQKAASLAVQYSKRKNESNCPVIMTERKYVRKKKGAPPGLVIVEKEKTIFS